MLKLLIVLSCVLLTSWAWADEGQDAPLMALDVRVRPGDTIRDLILKNNCVQSIDDYSKLRGAFESLNPDIFHSERLVPGKRVTIPLRQSESDGHCMKYAEQKMVRIELEIDGTVERVNLYLNGPVLPDVFVLKEQPIRVVCDFDGVLPAEDMPRELPSAGRLIRKIRIGREYRPFVRTRVVLEIDPDLIEGIGQDFCKLDSRAVITVLEKRQ